MQQLRNAPPFALFRENQFTVQYSQLLGPGFKLKVGTPQLIRAFRHAILQFIACLLQRLLRATLCRHIVKDEHRAGDLAVSCQNWRGAILNRNPPALSGNEHGIVGQGKNSFFPDGPVDNIPAVLSGRLVGNAENIGNGATQRFLLRPSALLVLKRAGINVEYMYSVARRSAERAVLIFRFDEIGRALEALGAAGITVLDRLDP